MSRFDRLEELKNKLAKRELPKEPSKKREEPKPQESRLVIRTVEKEIVEVDD